MQVSPHFSFEELIVSDSGARHGLDNTPGDAEKFALLNILVPGLEIIRGILNQPMHIDSAYRSPQVNVLIGGAEHSQHMKGEAADFIAPQFGTPYDICLALLARKAEVGYDQLIYEHTWTHVSFCAGQPRGEELTMRAGLYSPGIHP